MILMKKIKRLISYFTKAISKMKLLLDTHIFLWVLEGNKKLKNEVEEIIKNPQNQIFVSVVSGIEISIKSKTKKLKLKTTLKRMFEISGFEILNVNFNHLLEMDKLFVYHKDPFDRILISQAKVENLTLITSDEKIWRYDLQFIKT